MVVLAFFNNVGYIVTVRQSVLNKSARVFLKGNGCICVPGNYEQGNVKSTELFELVNRASLEACKFFLGESVRREHSLKFSGIFALCGPSLEVENGRIEIDFVNVSLNASCAEKYQPICRSQYGENGFAALVEFAKICKRNGVNCRFSIVDCIGEEEVEACKRLAASVNIPLYVRTYIADS